MGKKRDDQPTRRKKAIIIEDDDDDDDDLNVLSQQSSSSDHAAEILMAEKYITTSWEKKSERDKRFIQKAKRELNNRISGPTDELKDAMKAMNEIYTKFILDYAASEDVIRGIWIQIQEERQAFQKQVEEHLRACVEAAEKTEKGQIKGMALAKKACEDFRTAISSLQSAGNFRVS